MSRFSTNRFARPAVAVLGVLFACILALAAVKKGVSAARSPQETGVATERAAAVVADAVGGRPVSQGSMDMELAQLPGGVTVKGHLSIQDFRQSANYVWVMRIYDKATYDSFKYGEPLFEKVYADKVFTTPIGEAVNPEFEDTIQPQLPAGSYAVTLSVSYLHPGLTIHDIRDQEHLWKLSVVKTAGALEIQE